MAPDASKGLALIAFMEYIKWRKIAILSSTESIWFETRLGLRKQLVATGIEVLKPAAFERDSIKDAIGQVRRSGFRFVLVLAYDDDITTVASHAWKESMMRGWAWLVTVELVGGKALAGWLWFRPFFASDMRAFAMKVSNYTESHFNTTVNYMDVDLTHSTALFDAVMLYAHAATKLMIEGGDLRDYNAVAGAVRNTSFSGVGGTVVALDSNSDRIELYELMNYVIGEDGVKYEGMTFERTSIGFRIQRFEGGYYYCSKYFEVTPTIESSVEACKDACRGCSFLTYYAGLTTEFAKRCYLFKSAAECG